MGWNPPKHRYHRFKYGVACNDSPGVYGLFNNVGNIGADPWECNQLVMCVDEPEQASEYIWVKTRFFNRF